MLFESEKLTSTPVVSIVVLAYNHEKYIKICLENILNQNFHHNYEIIIADDCSQDATRDICYEYFTLYPNIVRLLFQESNQGLLCNYRDATALCRGKYIAQCAGDDYWCDRDKLRLQYEYLKNNKEYGFVRTCGYELKNNELIKKTGGHAYDVGDVRNIAIFGPVAFASSIFFERKLLSYIDFNTLIQRGITMEDYPMHAIFSHHTKFALIKKPMVVYRVLSESISHTKNYERKMNFYIGFYNCKKYIKELYEEECPWTLEELEDDINYQKLRYFYLKCNLTKARNIVFKTKKYDRYLLVRAKQSIIFFCLCSLILHCKR